MKRIGASVYYGMLVLVAIIWGIDPIVNSHLYRYYSASALSALSTCFTAILFLILSLKKLKLLNRDYLKIALPISLLNSLACLLQRIGLQYTTPAKYAFLEHLSCIVVPVLLILFFRKKPHTLQWLASVLCLGGCLILTGAGTEAVTFGIGELLCALAGILFGICIVATGAFTQRLDIGLYMTIHMFVYFLTSLGLMLILNHTSLEPTFFSWDIRPLSAAALFGILSVGLCWLLKTEATRHINPSAVAAIGPLAAVVSGVVSLRMGLESLSPSFFLSAAMIIGAAILSGMGESMQSKKDRSSDR